MGKTFERDIRESTWDRKRKTGMGRRGTERKKGEEREMQRQKDGERGRESDAGKEKWGGAVTERDGRQTQEERAVGREAETHPPPRPPEAASPWAGARGTPVPSPWALSQSFCPHPSVPPPTRAGLASQTPPLGGGWLSRFPRAPKADRQGPWGCVARRSSQGPQPLS